MSGTTVIVLVIAMIWATMALLTITARALHLLASAAITVLIVAALAAFIARMLTDSGRSREEER